MFINIILTHHTDCLVFNQVVQIYFYPANKNCGIIITRARLRQAAGESDAINRAVLGFYTFAGQMRLTRARAMLKYLKI